jgi:cytochrome c6
MTRSVAGFAALLAAALLAGCGGDEQAAAPAAPPPAPPTEATETEAPTTEAAPTEAATTEAATTEDEDDGGVGQGDFEAGKQVFETAGCVACHTLSAAAATGTVGPNLDERRPSFDKVIERVTQGKGVMPPFEGQLTEEQIRNVAHFVASATRGGT